MRRTRMLAGVVLCAGLALAACGGDDGPAGVASLGGSTTTTAKDGSGGKQSQEDAVVDYVRCLRKEGVDVDDPQPVSGDDDGTAFEDPPEGDGDAPRSHGVMITPAGRIDLPGPDDPTFKKADQTCRPILEAAEHDRPKPTPEEVAEQRDKALAFAKCMREHGIDMDDPKVGDDGSVQIQIGGPGKDDTANDGKKVQSAQRVCQAELPLGGSRDEAGGAGGTS